MTGTISRTFNTYRIKVLKLGLASGAPTVEVLDEFEEEVAGIMGEKSARKLAVTRNGGRLRPNCTVTFELVRSETWSMPADEFKRASVRVYTSDIDEEKA